jgi:CHASE1-domain containing sensor protein
MGYSMKLVPRSLAHLKGYWTAYVVLTISLALTVAGYIGHANYIRSREQARFSQAGRLAVEQVKERLDVYLSLMRGVSAFFSASQEVTPAELARFFSSLNITNVERNSGMDGIGVVVKVRPEQRARHLATLKAAFPN